MKILHINLASNLGGGEFQTLALMSELRTRGIEQNLIARKSSKFKMIAKEEGYETFSLFESLMNLQFCKEYSVLHAHDGRGAHIAAVTGRISKRPYIITRRITKPPTSRRWTKSVYKKASKIISISEAVSSSLERWQSGISSSVIHDALVFSAASRHQANQLKISRKGKMIVAQVGRLSREKGGEVTIEVARRIQAQGLPIEFWIIGDGKERSRLEKLALGLGNVFFFGYQSDVADYLLAADVLLHPAHSEAFGSVLLQAMQHSTSIVASRVGGIPEVLSEEYGELVDPGDVNGFCDAVVKLFKNPKLRTKYANMGTQRVEQFSAKAMADAYVRVYLKCLSGSY